MKKGTKTLLTICAALALVDLADIVAKGQMIFITKKVNVDTADVIIDAFNNCSDNKAVKLRVKMIETVSELFEKFS